MSCTSNGTSLLASISYVATEIIICARVYVCTHKYSFYLHVHVAIA